ncbi:MAG: hypothetical protein ACRCZ0_10980 [Cetobacterium sp.]
MKPRIKEIEMALKKLDNELELLEIYLVKEVIKKEEDLSKKLDEWSISDIGNMIRRKYIWSNPFLEEVLKDLERGRVDYNENDLVENVIDRLR